ncbi:MAG: hypothetical protein QGI78_02735 [Phycisphaerales bacterium]|jgi:hypothetical protein|nr:hypothetical protein [Phycisphaerales bacterium]
MDETVSTIEKNHLQRAPVSSSGRGGFWLAVVLATVGIGVLLSGVFSGATGLFGDVGEVTFSDGFRETWRELVRVLLFSTLLLVALRVNCWRVRRSLGNFSLAALRCLAIVAIIESVRVVQIPHGVSRVFLVSASQYLLLFLCFFGLFKVTARESIVFTTSCTVALIVLWVGSMLGNWVS